MPPKRTVVCNEKAGSAFQFSLQELKDLEMRTRFQATAPWGPRIRSYPHHRRHIQEAADGLKAVQDIVTGIELPVNVAKAEVSWTAVITSQQGKGKTQTKPRNVWRDNTCNLWWSITVPLTDEWERCLDVGHAGPVEKALDDLTTAVGLLQLVLFPNQYDRLF